MFNDKTLKALPVERHEVSYLRMLGAKQQRSKHWC